MIDLFVVWVVDGPTMVTCLQYEDTPEQREMIKQWTQQQIMEQAADVEDVPIDRGYELVAIFTAQNLEFIF